MRTHQVWPNGNTKTAYNLHLTTIMIRQINALVNVFRIAAISLIVGTILNWRFDIIRLQADRTENNKIKQTENDTKLRCHNMKNWPPAAMTSTWIDYKNKLGFSLPPKCASTTLRMIQMAKVGFI